MAAFLSINFLLLVIELIQLFSLGLFKYLGEIDQLFMYYLTKISTSVILLFYYQDNLVLFMIFCGINLLFYSFISIETKLYATRIELAIIIIGISALLG